ncbi:hypothetical protein DMENIID0001_152380 [Sergentomyia squamirostris]
MYYKFSLILFYLTIYSQLSIVVYGEGELRTKKKKGQQDQQQEQQQQQQQRPTVCIVPLPLQTYQPSYVHSGDQFQHSYIGSSQELRKKGKPSKNPPPNQDNSGCVIVTAQPMLHTLETPQGGMGGTAGGEQQLKKKKKKPKPGLFKPTKHKRRRRKQQAQMLAQMEHDLKVAVKDLMASLDYFWPKLQITFTTGTASIGHNIFSGMIPLFASTIKLIKLKKMFFLLMDPMWSSIMYSMGYSSRPRPRPKTEQPEENTEMGIVQEQPDGGPAHEAVGEQIHYSEPVVSQSEFYNQKEDEEEEDTEEDDSEEDEEENDEEEGQDDEDSDEEDEEEDSDEKEDADEEENDESVDHEDEDEEETADDSENVDYPSKEQEDISTNVNFVKKPQKSDFFQSLKFIWEGMVTGFDDLFVADNY